MAKLKYTGDLYVTGILNAGAGQHILAAGSVLGVGTSNPQYTIHSMGSTGADGILNEQVFSNYASPTYLSRKARGTPTTMASPIYGDGLVALSGEGFMVDTGAYSPEIGVLMIRAGETITSTTCGTFASIEVVPLGNPASQRRPVVAIYSDHMRLGYNLANFNELTTANYSAGTFKLHAPRSNGSAVAGTLVVQVGRPGASGSVVQTMYTLWTFDDQQVILDDGKMVHRAGSVVYRYEGVALSAGALVTGSVIGEFVQRTVGTRHLWTSDGNNIDMQLSAAGGNLQVRGTLTHGDTTLLRTTVALTNGAASAAGTISNAPTVGNPTKWVPINDNGTTRYIPAW